MYAFTLYNAIKKCIFQFSALFEKRMDKYGNFDMIYGILRLSDGKDLLSLYCRV
jgi:hypothetical protein